MSTTSFTDAPMRIQVISDLHLEFDRPDQGLAPYQYIITPHAEILALLGDIGTTLGDELFDWLLIQLKQFKLVFFLCGNHEAYRSSLETSTRRLVGFAEKCTTDPSLGRFVLLDRTRYDLSSTFTVLGCTLWSQLDLANVDVIKLGLNDFRRIADLTPDIYQNLHRVDVEWLRRTIQEIHESEPHRKVVVMTHHAPTVEGTSDPRYNDSPIASAFSTEILDTPDWNGKQVKMWLFGHTHWPCDFVRNDVRVMSNPRGYRDGQRGYDPAKSVEV
ncbi:Ser/Thr protein phosphatase protein [Daedaleopsis nitida]|nr:Ser/Thr protein phosphatase protein [Daedaleopsis nitida]